MKKILQFLWNDIKSDWQAIKKMGSDEHNKKVWTRIKNDFSTGWDTFLKDNWMMYLMIILAFFVGFFVAAKYYQNQCNLHIIKEFYPHILEPMKYKSFFNESINLSLIK